MLELFQQLIQFLTGFLDYLKAGGIIGIVCGLMISAIGLLIYVKRFFRLGKLRQKDEIEEIEAGKIEGKAEGYRLRKEELKEHQEHMKK